MFNAGTRRTATCDSHAPDHFNAKTPRKREMWASLGNVRSSRFSGAPFVVHALACEMFVARAQASGASPRQPEGWTTNQMPSRRALDVGSTRDASSDDLDGRAPQSTSTQRRGENGERGGPGGAQRVGRTIRKARRAGWRR